MGIQINVLGSHQRDELRLELNGCMTYAKLTIEYARPNRPPTSLALDICPMQAGARLRNDPDAKPKITEKTYSPGRVLPNGNQITNTANAPKIISAACVLILPYRSAIPPASNRPNVEAL